MSQEQQLARGLSARHIRMMAIGGTIGAGIFMGSADTIALAGPGVIIAYVIAGILLYMVMGGLAEMGSAFPHLDVRGMVHRAFGPRVSFVTGWLYWLNWVIVLAVEIVAAGTFLHFWFSSVPVWILSVICALLVLGMNVASVTFFGEVEFWLSGIKVVTLLAFVILGGYLLFTNPATSDLSNYTIHGGFFPTGILGIATSMLVVVFSFGGTELIGLTLRETKEAKDVLPKVLRGVVVRVSLFYVLPLLIICGLVPWDQVGKAGSPFVSVLQTIGLNQAAHVMNFVMFIAVISAANSGVYATSRMLHSLAKDGEAPKIFLRLSKQNVPFIGLLVSGMFFFLGAGVAMVAPKAVFSILMSIPGVTVLLMWIAICSSQLKLRLRDPEYVQPGSFLLRGFPYTSGIALISFLIILLIMLLDPKNLTNTIVCAGIVIILYLLSVWTVPKSR